MKEFVCHVRLENGLHARPASKIAAISREFNCEILISTKGKMVKATRIVDIIELGLKQSDNFKVTCEGVDEQKASEALLLFCEQNL